MTKLGSTFTRALLSAALLLGASEALADGPSAFAYLHRLATNPRCVNCHGVIVNGQHVPTVGDDRHLHPMNVQSRITDLGYQCTSCHQRRNLDLDGTPPGAANDRMPDFLWHMPVPMMMLRPDMSPQELCNLWTDPQRNSTTPGGRGSLQDLATFRREFIHHVSDDPLIIWTFNPGGNRTPSPGSPDQMVAAMNEWIGWLEAGHNCSEL